MTCKHCYDNMNRVRKLWWNIRAALLIIRMKRRAEKRRGKK